VRRHLTRWLASAAVLVGASSPLGAGAQQMLVGHALVDALKAGGYVIVMRHTTTEAKPDAANVDLANCATQRNLTTDGRVLARSIGNAIDALQIPVGRVTSSPFCRAEDTAGLAFGHGDTNAGLGEKAVKNPATSAEAAAALRPLIAAPVARGTNAAFVTHGFNIKSIVGDDFAEGEAAIFKPDGKGGFLLVARVMAQDWSKLGGWKSAQ
jgi:phosphohistidine phosphatase SixA